MIYMIYTFQYEAIKFLYGPGKGHQEHNINKHPSQFISYKINEVSIKGRIEV